MKEFTILKVMSNDGERRGRPTTQSHARTSNLHVRLTAQDHAELKMLARSYGVNVSDLIRLATKQFLHHATNKNVTRLENS